MNYPNALIAESIELQLTIANHPETLPELLTVLVESNDPTVAEAARLHVNWAEQIQD